MMTLAEMKTSQRIRIHRRGEWVSAGPSSNNQKYIWTIQIVYTRKNGERLVIGEARAKTEAKATDAAYAAALAWVNEP